MRVFGIVLTAVFMAAPLVVAAETGAWVRNPVTNCHAWNSSSEPNRTFTWSGGCQNNVAQGRGVMEWFTNGQHSGRYVGEYANGRMNGRGVFDYANGDVYDGEFRDDRPNGRGAFRAANGNRFSGLLLDGGLVQGEAMIDNGKAYKGAFRDGQAVRGKASYPDGSAYTGDLRDDRPNGWGVFTTAAGGRYEGEFADGKPNGFGTYGAPAGEVYAGLWTGGCFQQRGRSAAVIATEQACSTRPAAGGIRPAS